MISSSKKNEFEVLVKANMKRAYFSALGLVGSHDDAMEISQEAFIRAYRNFDKFDENRKFFTWYYKILKNLCLNFLRDKKKIIAGDFLEFSADENISSQPEKIFERKEIAANIEESLSEISFEDREILILREFEGLSYKEISELLNVPEGSVMSRLFYARKKLAEKMKRKMK